jgi:hypothetical protein
VDVFLAGGERFLNRSPVYPQRPRPLAPGLTERIDLPVGESPGRPPFPGARPDVRLRFRIPRLGDPRDFAIRLNGAAVSKGAAAGSWLEYAVQPSLVKIGDNRVEISLRRTRRTGLVLKDILLVVRYANRR